MNKKYIGHRITEIRKRNRLSTSDLARLVNKSQATISRIENGRQSITLNLLLSIAQALSVHPLQLIGLELTDRPRETVTGCLGSALRSARLYHNLPINEAAGVLNRSERYIDDIENSRILPERSELEELSALYNLDPHLLEELLYLEENAPGISHRFSRVTTLLSECIFPENSAEWFYKPDLSLFTTDKNTLDFNEITTDILTKNINPVLLKILSRESE